MNKKPSHELIHEYILTILSLNPYGGNKAKIERADKIGEELIKRGLLTEEEHEDILR